MNKVCALIYVILTSSHSIFFVGDADAILISRSVAFHCFVSRKYFLNFFVHKIGEVHR